MTGATLVLDPLAEAIRDARSAGLRFTVDLDDHAGLHDRAGGQVEMGCRCGATYLTPVRPWWPDATARRVAAFTVEHGDCDPTPIEASPAPRVAR